MIFLGTQGGYSFGIYSVQRSFYFDLLSGHEFYYLEFERSVQTGYLTISLVDSQARFLHEEIQSRQKIPSLLYRHADVLLQLPVNLVEKSAVGLSLTVEYLGFTPDVKLWEVEFDKSDAFRAVN